MRRRPWIESKPERVAFARDLRGAPTDAEERLWYFLRSRRFQRAKFRRQVPVGPYVVDFLCVSASLVIEADGGQHSERAAYDEERTNYLEAKGYRVLRFWNKDVMRNIEGVMQVIAMTLTPGPSPKGEGSNASTSTMRRISAADGLRPMTACAPNLSRYVSNTHSSGGGPFPAA